MRQNVMQHEGNKYLRIIRDAINPDHFCTVDVYAVLEAFNVTCPARQHAIKKLLCAGIRGKGSEMDDLKGAMAALNRAIDLQEMRENSIVSGEEQMEEEQRDEKEKSSSTTDCIHPYLPCGHNGCYKESGHTGDHSFNDPKEYD